MQYFVFIDVYRNTTRLLTCYEEKKKQWLQICNGMMSGALVLLGFTSCDENSTGTGRCEYGTPYAKYEIKGKVIRKRQQIYKF